jgi:hypothetical protein
MSGKLRMERCKLAGACATSIYMGYAIWLICSYAHAQGVPAAIEQQLARWFTVQ